MRLHSDQESREINLFHVNGFESYYKFSQCSLCQTGMKSPLKWHIQPGKKLKSFRKSIVQYCTMQVCSLFKSPCPSPMVLFVS